MSFFINLWILWWLNRIALISKICIQSVCVHVRVCVCGGVKTLFPARVCCALFLLSKNHQYENYNLVSSESVSNNFCSTRLSCPISSSLRNPFTSRFLKFIMSDMFYYLHMKKTNSTIKRKVSTLFTP